MGRQASVAGAARKRNGVATHLTKDELLAQMQARQEPFALPGGGTILIRSILLRDLQSIQGITGDDRAGTLKKLCLLGIAEPQLELADLEAMDDASAGLVARIAMAIERISGLAPDAVSDFLPATPKSKG